MTKNPIVIDLLKSARQSVASKLSAADFNRRQVRDELCRVEADVKQYTEMLAALDAEIGS